VGVVTDVTELTDAIAKATEAKSENLQLIQAWSHDLKGHAKGVFDELSTLKRLKPEFKTDAERISFEAALDRSELTFKIIQNTRDLGDLEIKPQRTSTKEILDRINLIHRDKNIKYNWPETEHFIDMDIDRFISMGFNNLIENAFKYSLGSNPEVVVGLKIDKGLAKFFVQDFGLGMDEAGQAKVMAGNFGSRVRLNPQIEGTGQGIFSAKRVFKAHDAELSLKSKLGQGSIFVVKVKMGDK
jgi:K+-sensing histidine kinase KdpD